MATRKRYGAVAVLGIGVASALAWWWQKPPTPAPAPTTATPAGGAPRAAAVEVASVKAMPLVDEAQSVGSLRSRQGVMLRPEVAGRVREVRFADGQRVQRGQLLVQLDDQLPMAQLAQARAEMGIAQANHQRNQELVAKGFISQRSLDESAAALEVAKAKLDLAQATVQRLKVLAPFDGVLGLRQVNVGDYLKDGADIVNLEDTDAVLVDFRLPERFQSKIRPGQKAQITLDALPGRPFEALVQAVDPLIDANGRSVGVRGCIDNRQGLLRPGMFARVNTVFAVREGALVVPEEALVPQGPRTTVVKLVPGDTPDALVAQRVVVKTGLRLPGRVEITEGLQEGETVVTAGHQRLQKDGTPVRVVDLNAPRGGAAAAPASGASTPPASPASAPASAPAAMPAPASAPSAIASLTAAAARPAPAGPNPCLRG